MRIRAYLVGLLWVCLAVSSAAAQQSPGGSAASNVPANADFLRDADDVMAEMSKLLSLPVREPLKRSVRTKEEIREYLLRSSREDRDDAKRHADVRMMEALGLLPKNYPLEQKLIELLTQQIAGVYDPKEREFFISETTEPVEERVVMAHELTHALEDQNFHVERWEKAAKGNDDALLARQAVLEGSAMIGMIDYLLRDTGTSFSDLGKFDPSLLLGDVEGNEELNGVPLVLKDQLLFPYLAGAAFSAKALEAGGGWPGLHTIFEKPPASTQQIMHPELYLRGVQPEAVHLPAFGGLVPRGWKKLDENVMGEFGLHQMFKQFLGKQRADELAASWSGDRYAIWEQSPQGPTLMVMRVRLGAESETTSFFEGYRQLLEKKHADAKSPVSQPNSFFVETAEGGAFIRCVARDCLLGEGATRAQFDALIRSIGWPALHGGTNASVRAAARTARMGLLPHPIPPPMVLSAQQRQVSPEHAGVR
jgi:hypothetical protein